jgi:hypothetical protein
MSAIPKAMTSKEALHALKTYFTAEFIRSNSEMQRMKLLISNTRAPMNGISQKNIK